jgi:hypothetical protein
MVWCGGTEFERGYVCGVMVSKIEDRLVIGGVLLQSIFDEWLDEQATSGAELGGKYSVFAAGRPRRPDGAYEHTEQRCQAAC